MLLVSDFGYKCRHSAMRRSRKRWGRGAGGEGIRQKSKYYERLLHLETAGNYCTTVSIHSRV